MVFVGSRLKIIDNSGARIVECIKVLGNRGVTSKPGSLIVVSVKSVNPKKRLKKGEIYRAVFVASKKSNLRPNGFSVSFSENCAVLVNNKGVPIATRLLAPVMLEVRDNGFTKVLSMSTFSV